MEKVSIIVDNRERNPAILGGLAVREIALDFAQLPVGDYIVSDRIGIERKTVRDFENSIMDSRLFDQARRLREGFEKPILLIEGHDSEFSLGRRIITGAILKLYLEYDVQVITSSDAEETAYMIARFAEREQIEGREARIAGRKKAHSDQQWQLLILGSVPGVGPALAKGLIARFGTVRGVAEAGEKELMEVENVGRKKAMRIHSIMNSKFSEGGAD
jgi:ERCC4-type nuclease